jgi:hypothetical protein
MRIENNIKIADKRPVELQHPMVAVEFRTETKIGAIKFKSGWYPVMVNQYADQLIQSDQQGFQKFRDCQILCIAWNCGQLDMTAHQCNRVQAIWDVPILEPYLFHCATSHSLWPEGKPKPKL